MRCKFLAIQFLKKIINTIYIDEIKFYKDGCVYTIQ